MNLEQTIADLDRQAAQYTEAANALRSLLGQGGGQAPAASKAGAGKSNAGRKASKKAGAAKKRQGSRKAAVTPETRAKISEALRASHAARKAQSSSSGASVAASDSAA